MIKITDSAMVWAVSTYDLRSNIKAELESSVQLHQKKD